MTPLPAFDFDNSDIFDAYDNNQGPFRLRKPGRPDLVVVDATEYEAVSAEPDFDRIGAAVRRGADECDKGDDMDAFESLAMIRTRYGL